MEPSPHNPILPQKNTFGLNSMELKVFMLRIHSVLTSTICWYSYFDKGQATSCKKNETVVNRMFRTRGLNNKVVLELGKLSKLCLYFPKG